LIFSSGILGPGPWASSIVGLTFGLGREVEGAVDVGGAVGVVGVVGVVDLCPNTWDSAIEIKPVLSPASASAAPLAKPIATGAKPGMVARASAELRPASAPSGSPGSVRSWVRG